MTMPRPAAPLYPALVERWGTEPAGVVLICEHASNAMGDAGLGGDLGLSAAARMDHVAWDIGALGLARELGQRLAVTAGGAALVHAPLSRLVYDLNRAPDHPTAMPAKSEIHDVPGNRNLTPTQRMERVARVYAPFHAGLSAEIARHIAQGRRPALIAVHSFTPIFHGQRREVEFGVIHDDDTALTMAVLEAARSAPLITRLNEPYSAAGDVTHTIRVHAVPNRLANTMLEIRNDLIADAPAQAAMADRLAPILAQALAKTGALAWAC